MIRALALATVLLAACGGDRVTTPPALDAGPRHPHAAPTGQVRAYPPHAIRSDGVGPYLLGQPVTDVLRSEGPRLELLQIGRHADWHVVRADGGAILVGAEHRSGKVAFIAVLKSDIARTASGIAVGSAVADLLKSLGGERERGDLARDRRLVEVGSLPGVRFVTDGADKPRVIAVLVTRAESEGDDEQATCRGGGALAGAAAEVIGVARGKAGGGSMPGSAPALVPPPVIRYGCVTDGAPEALVLLPGEAVLVGGEPGKLKRLGAVTVPAGDLLALIDLDGDGKDELVTAGQRRADKEVAVEARIVRWDGAHLVDALVDRPYVIGEAAAAAVGTTPGDIDVLPEVRPARGGVEVSAIYLAHDAGGGVREAAPLAPVTLRLRPTSQPVPIATGDAGAAPPAADGKTP